MQNTCGYNIATLTALQFDKVDQNRNFLLSVWYQVIVKKSLKINISSDEICKCIFKAQIYKYD